MSTITFKVNLETQSRQSSLLPNRITLSGNETVTEAVNMKNTRTIYLPGLLNNNHTGTTPASLHHGDTFVVSGLQAQYLKRTYVTGSVEDVLQIVSEV